MIHEFALEPTLLSSWDNFRYLVEKFGIQHGRLISRFPKKWKRLVYEACSACKEIERKKIEESLKEVDKKLLKTNRAYDGNLGWLENAEIQHALKPFRAIIAKANPRAVVEVLIADELVETTPLWDVPREIPISRNAKGMAESVSLLLARSSEILFVDPHFAPEMLRYKRTFEQFLLVSASGRTDVRRIEFHLLAKAEKDFFVKACTQLASLVPRGIAVTFIRWMQRDGGEALHPRYVLTNLGGVRFEQGLDEGRDGETVDVSLLDPGLYSKRWGEFQKMTAAFDYVDEFTIIGAR